MFWWKVFFVNDHIRKAHAVALLIAKSTRVQNGSYRLFGNYSTTTTFSDEIAQNVINSLWPQDGKTWSLRSSNQVAIFMVFHDRNTVTCDKEFDLYKRLDTVSTKFGSCMTLQIIPLCSGASSREAVVQLGTLRLTFQTKVYFERSHYYLSTNVQAWHKWPLKKLLSQRWHKVRACVEKTIRAVFARLCSLLPMAVFLAFARVDMYDLTSY